MRRRPQRELISLMIVRLILVVGRVAQCVYSYLSADSSFNRLKESEKWEKELDQKIKVMEEDLVRAGDTRQDMLNLTKVLDARIHSNAVGTKQLSTLLPNVALTAANMTFTMMRQRESC